MEPATKLALWLCLGYILGGHPDNAAWLQQRFSVLPLVTALRQQGIEPPSLDRAHRNRAGVDLLRHGRLRTNLKRVLPVALVLGALSQHFARHQHYFFSWSTATWAAQDDGSIQPLPLQLPVRVGPGGLWQHYDVEELNARIADFLDQQKRAQLPAPGFRKTDT